MKIADVVVIDAAVYHKTQIYKTFGTTFDVGTHNFEQKIKGVISDIDDDFVTIDFGTNSFISGIFIQRNTKLGTSLKIGREIEVFIPDEGEDDGTDSPFPIWILSVEDNREFKSKVPFEFTIFEKPKAKFLDRDLTWVVKCTDHSVYLVATLPSNEMCTILLSVTNIDIISHMKEVTGRIIEKKISLSANGKISASMFFLVTEIDSAV